MVRRAIYGKPLAGEFVAEALRRLAQEFAPLAVPENHKNVA